MTERWQDRVIAIGSDQGIRALAYELRAAGELYGVNVRRGELGTAMLVIFGAEQDATHATEFVNNLVKLIGSVTVL